MGLFILPMSWYRAPARTSCTFAPTAPATASAMFITCRECWKVPGAFCSSSWSRGLDVSQSSLRRYTETRLNIFSKRYERGYPATQSMAEIKSSNAVRMMFPPARSVRRSPRNTRNITAKVMIAFRNCLQPLLKVLNVIIEITPPARKTRKTARPPSAYSRRGRIEIP